MRDTFTSIFPNYTHGTGTVFNQPISHNFYSYPDKNIDGEPIHKIDRTHTHKMDFLKMYTEEILKIANMRRQIK